jgi:hypothetical protein
MTAHHPRFGATGDEMAEALARGRERVDEAQDRKRLAADRAANRRYVAALAASGGRFRDVADPAGALLPSQIRLRDVRTLSTMTEHRQERVLLSKLTECVSHRGATYLRGWCGISNLVAFKDEPDEQGRPCWLLYLVERRPRPGIAPDNQRQRQERTSGAVASGVDLDDSIPF